MRTRRVCGGVAAAGALLACGGCGFKGPLYLPERNVTVVTHPARAARQPAPAGQQSQAPAPRTAPPPGSAQAPGGKSKDQGSAPSGAPVPSPAPPQSTPP